MVDTPDFNRIWLDHGAIYILLDELRSLSRNRLLVDVCLLKLSAYCGEAIVVPALVPDPGFGGSLGFPSLQDRMPKHSIDT